MFFLEAGVALVAFVLGVAFSQKIKDFWNGVPGEVRAKISEFEKSLVSKL